MTLSRDYWYLREKNNLVVAVTAELKDGVSKAYAKIRLTKQVRKLNLVESLSGFSVAHPYFHKINAELNELINFVCKAGANISRMTDGISIKIHRSIEECQTDRLEALIDLGGELFPKESPLDRLDKIYGLPLNHAILKNQAHAVKLLLEGGASAKSTTNRCKVPLVLAINQNSLCCVELLLIHGAANDKKDLDYLNCAIKKNHKAIINELLKYDMLLNARQIKTAIENREMVLAQKLFNRLNENNDALQIALDDIITHSPLEFLEWLVENKKQSNEARLTTPLYKRRQGKLQFLGFSGTKLLITLLKNNTQPVKRLAILQQIVMQLMTIKHFPASVEHEPCHANLTLIEQLKESDPPSPISDAAKSLHALMMSDYKQGVIRAGVLVLSEILRENNLIFDTGKQFIQQVIQTLIQYHKENQQWPSNAKADALIKRIAKNISMHDDTEAASTPFSDEAIKFGAIVGSKHFVPSKDGGYYSDAILWHMDIINQLAGLLTSLNMFAANWDTEKLKTFVAEFGGHSDTMSLQDKVKILIEQKPKAIGFPIDFPEHIMYGSLYQNHQKNWVYTILCRNFLQTDPDITRYGAVDFIIPNGNFDALFLALGQEICKNKDSHFCHNDRSVDREILHALILHLKAVEEITNTTCVYSERASQGSYKESTCFVSNIKGIFHIILSTIVSKDATPAQWAALNNQLKDLILAEIQKTSVARRFTRTMKKTKPQPDNNLSPKQEAYKLLTSLLRWMEINQFNPRPDSPEEQKGKKDVQAHTLTLTQKRFQTGTTFFKSPAVSSLAAHPEEAAKQPSHRADLK